MSFKGQHLGMVLAGCLLAGAAHAQGGEYAKVQLAIGDIDGMTDDAIALVGTYGVKLPQVHQNFSVEGEFTTTIVDAEYETNFVSAEISYYSIGGYGVYTHPINPSFGIYGRAGLVYDDVTAEVCNKFINDCVEESDGDLSLSFGVGTNVAIGQTTDFTAGITVLEEDITHFSAGAQFRF